MGKTVREDRKMYLNVYKCFIVLYLHFFWDYFSVFSQQKQEGRRQNERIYDYCVVFELVNICLPMKRNSSLLLFKLIFLSIFCGLKIFSVPSDKRAVKKRGTALQDFSNSEKNSTTIAIKCAITIISVVLYVTHEFLPSGFKFR